MLKVFICLVFSLTLNALFCQSNHYAKAVKYLELYQIDSAYSEMGKVLKESSRVNGATISKYYVKYAEILKFKPKADSSLYYILKAKKWYQKTKNIDSIIYTTTFEAELYRSIDKRNKSIEVIKNLGRIVDHETVNPNILAFYYNRKLAVLNFYLEHDSLDVNLKLIQQIYALEPMITTKDIIAYTLNEQGYIFAANQKMDSAILTYDKAYEYAHKHKLIIPEIDILTNIGIFHIRINNRPKKGIENFKKAEKLAVEINSVFQQYYLYINMKNAYYLDGNMAEAYNYSEKTYGLAQLYNGSQEIDKVKAIERKYSIEIKEKEIDLKNSQLLSARRKFWYLIIVLLMTGILGLILVYNYRKIRRSNKKLDSLSKENEFLMKEANHRINNNLQLVLILINTELKKATGTEANQIKKVLSNVGSIATLHKHLYKGDDKNKVQISDYLNEIYINLFELFKVNDIESTFKIDKILVQTDISMYLGLIVTELCVNSLKYAFTDQANKLISLTLKSNNSETILEYFDNGQNSFGKNIQPVLIDKLCRQLRAKYEIDSSNGFSIKIVLPSIR